MSIIKISTKGKYGLIAMADLAASSSQGKVTLKSIADRQGISENYLEQLFSVLKKAGLVKSIKGAQGGYLLTDDAKNITVGKVLRALEGELTFLEKKEGHNYTSVLEFCISTEVWNKLDQAIYNIIDEITLADLAKKYTKLKDEQNIMYYI